MQAKNTSFQEWKPHMPLTQFKPSNGFPKIQINLKLLHCLQSSLSNLVCSLLLTLTHCILDSLPFWLLLSVPKTHLSQDICISYSLHRKYPPHNSFLYPVYVSAQIFLILKGLPLQLYKKLHPMLPFLFFILYYKPITIYCIMTFTTCFFH